VDLLPLWLCDKFPMAHFTMVALSPVSLVLCDSLAPTIWVLEVPEDYPQLVSSKNLIKEPGNKRPRLSQGTFQFLKLTHADVGGLTEWSQTIWFWMAELLNWDKPSWCRLKYPCIPRRLYVQGWSSGMHRSLVEAYLGCSKILMESSAAPQFHYPVQSNSTGLEPGSCM
jgi:hypothetical protein